MLLTTAETTSGRATGREGGVQPLGELLRRVLAERGLVREPFMADGDGAPEPEERFSAPRSTRERSSRRHSRSVAITEGLQPRSADASSALSGK